MTNKRQLTGLVNAAVLASGIALAGTALASDIFSYSVVNFPKTELGCADQAAQLGRLVADRTGVEIYSTKCEKQWSDSYYLTVNYVADAKLSVVTTDLYDPLTYDRGIYASMEACLADLPAQIAAYQQATGVSPILHYCYDNHQSSSFPIYLKIEGFGEPEVRPIGFSHEIFSTPVGDLAQINATLVGNLRAMGVNVIGAVLSKELMESRITVNYYGDEELLLSLSHNWGYDSAELCQSQASEVAALFNASGQQVVLAYCGHKYMSNFTELTLLTNGLSKTVTRTTIPVSYNTFLECQAGRDQAIEFYKRSHGGEVYGAICSRPQMSSDYRIEIFAETVELR